MKRRLVSVLLGFSILFIGAFTVKAEASHSSVSTVKMSKKSVAVKEIKLKKIESILNKARTLSKQNCSADCTDLLMQVVNTWGFTQFICSMTGWGSSTCNGWIDTTLKVGDAWAAVGCDAGFDGTVTARNNNRRPQMIRKESFG